VDTASDLALLQEEELESRRRSFTSKHDYKDHYKPNSKDFTVGESLKPCKRKKNPRRSRPSKLMTKWLPYWPSGSPRDCVSLVEKNG
jgi:hypothetical protein